MCVDSRPSFHALSRACENIVMLFLCVFFALRTFILVLVLFSAQEHVNDIVRMTYQYLNMIREDGLQVGNRIVGI